MYQSRTNKIRENKMSRPIEWPLFSPLCRRELLQDGLNLLKLWTFWHKLAWFAPHSSFLIPWIFAEVLEGGRRALVVLS